MRTIKRYFQTIRQAERYLQRLYDRYHCARLVGFPQSSEAGYYTFFVTE